MSLKSELEEEFKEVYEKSKEFLRKFDETGDLSYAPKEFGELLRYRIFREIYTALIQLAVSRESVSYGDFARIVNSFLNAEVIPTQGSWLGTSLGTIFGTISFYEFSVGRPLLSILVYNAKTKEPGEGFSGLVDWLEIKINQKCEMERVFITWGGFEEAEEDEEE